MTKAKWERVYYDLQLKVQSNVVGKSQWKQLEVRLSTDQGRLAVRVVRP